MFLIVLVIANYFCLSIMKRVQLRRHKQIGANFSWIPINISESLYFSFMIHVLLQHLLKAFLLYWYCAYLRLNDMLIISAFLQVFSYSLFFILCCEAPLWWFDLRFVLFVTRESISFILSLLYSIYFITVPFNFTINFVEITKLP